MNTSLLRTSAIALGSFALLCLATTSLQAQVLYRQTFGTTTNNVSVGTVGWTVATGEGATNYTTGFSTGNGLGGWLNNSNGNPQNLPNINTGSTSTSETTGLAVVSLTNSSNHLGIIYTSPFSLNPADYSAGLQFSWNQGNSSTTINYRVAIQVNGAWYASTQTFANATAVGSVANFASQSVAMTFDFNTLAATWRNLDFTLSQKLALGSTLTSNLSEGNITGFGLYMDTPSGGTSRFDTFTITAVPEPTTVGLALLSLAGGLLISRRRRD